MPRWLGTAARLFAGMMTGFACVVFGLLAFMMATGPAQQANHDPIIRFDLANVSPPTVIADSPGYQPIGDNLEQVGLLAVIAHSTLPALARLAAPTSSVIDSRDAGGMADIYRDAPRLDLPKLVPDAPIRTDETSNFPTTPHLRNIGGEQPTARAELPIGLSVVPRSGGDTRQTGPEHFLQGGYFAHRENAVGLFEDLSDAGLDVLMEKTKNRIGKIRWQVLVGPYRQKEDALRARSSAPKLLAEAFYTVLDN